MRFARVADQYTEPGRTISRTTARATSSAASISSIMRAGLLDLDAQLERSYDRYAFMRNAWLQRREYQVRDGNVEDQSLELEEEFKDDPPTDRSGTAGGAPPAEPPRRHPQ